MNITIKKASIKNRLFLAYSYEQMVSNRTDSVSTSSDAPIHDDLRTAFNALIPHFAFICEEITENVCREQINNYEQGIVYSDPLANPLKKYTVKGFSIGGSGDSEGVTISGNKMLESGKIISFNTPFMKWSDEYSFANELINSVDLLKSEVYEYLEGKQAPKAQQSMTFQQDEEEEPELESAEM